MKKLHSCRVATKLVEVPHLDPRELGWRGHHLDHCAHMMYDRDRLLDTIGICVDVCLICGHEQSHRIMKAYRD